MLRILSKEFNGFLNSLIAYLVIGVFLTGIGLLMWVFPETSVLEFGYADMDTLFSLCPYVFIFLIPAITMRTFAEELRSGTMEILLTKPLTDWQIVTGKFLACYFLVILALMPTVIYYFSIYQLGNPVGNIDTPGVIGSYIGITLLAGVFCSIGMLGSAISPNQIVSFILAAFLCFLFFAGFQSLALMDPGFINSMTIRQIGISFHYEAMSKGLIDSRDVLYFVSFTLLMLLLTRIILGSRSW